MEQRLIDANALMESSDNMIAIEWNHKVAPASWADAEEEFKQRLLDAPTVDAVEVVRCGECLSCEAHFKRNGEVYFYRCSFFDIEVEPQDFCSYGERRDSDG